MLHRCELRYSSASLFELLETQHGLASAQSQPPKSTYSRRFEALVLRHLDQPQTTKNLKFCRFVLLQQDQKDINLERKLRTILIHKPCELGSAQGCFGLATSQSAKEPIKRKVNKWLKESLPKLPKTGKPVWIQWTRQPQDQDGDRNKTWTCVSALVDSWQLSPALRWKLSAAPPAI